MSAKKKHEDHANHEAWAIPYADLLTLLLAFFVVMYALSSVDVGKYRVLSNSLIEAFGAPGRVDPVEIGDPSMMETAMDDNDVKRSMTVVEMKKRVSEYWKTVPPGDSPEETESEVEPTQLFAQSTIESVDESERQQILLAIADIAEEIEKSLHTLIEEQVIKLKHESYWMEIEINTNLLFPSGSAVIEEAARPILSDVAAMLANRPLRIHVEGHTDDIPINNSIYPSNWELSSGRAASVVHLFAENGVDPKRMVAMGYGEYDPIASNETAEGRAQNRRVTIILLPADLPRAQNSVGPERLKGDYQQIWQEDEAQPSAGNGEAGSMEPMPLAVSPFDITD
jgi:chemotaxis protein MotB